MGRPLSATAGSRIVLDDPAPAARSFSLLGLSCSVLVTDPGMAAAAEQFVRDELGRLDRACSRFRTDSELEAVHRAAGAPVVVSPLLAELVDAAIGAARLSNGLVDPTVGSALVELGYDRDFAALPADGPAPTHLVPAPGWRTLAFDREAPTLAIPPGVRVDLGATAKAVAADRAAQRLSDGLGVGVLVNFGGDLAACGMPPRPGWSVGIAGDSATAPQRCATVVAIHGGGLATSGVGVRSWRRGGRRLHHIVDPRTGDAARSPWVLASVTARSCLVANVASTASILLGDEAPDWLEEGGFAARLVRSDGRVVTVGGWPDDAR